MRLRVQQTLSISFEKPARSLMLALKTMPRDHEGQVVISWRVEPSIDGRLRAGEDPFGNREHLFQAEGPIDELAVSIDGVVETCDTAGVVRGAREPLPPGIFLRAPASNGLERIAPEQIAPLRAATLRVEGSLQRMHALMFAVAERAAPEAPAIRHQHQQQAGGFSRPQEQQQAAMADAPAPAMDLAVLFVAVARDIGVPARIVRGAVASLKDDAGRLHTAGEAYWAEAHVDGLGWVGYDPLRRLCPTPAHLRIAVGLDPSDVAAWRLAQTGGVGERTRMVTAIAEG